MVSVMVALACPDSIMRVLYHEAVWRKSAEEPHFGETLERIVVIGAGIGGLTAAALLAQAGLSVTVLEAHVYPGGCAGTFFHGGYRFDAGATLAAGFEPGGGMTRLGAALGITWPVELAAAALAVHLPDGAVVTRWTDPGRWQAERRAAFGDAGEGFWRWQERTADLLWRAALDGVPWPPQRLADLPRLAAAGLGIAAAGPWRLPGVGRDAFRPAAAHLGGLPARLRQYVDGQLLIAAQATSERANALYAAASLDMPRRGAAHVRGGIGQIAVLLAEAVQRHGGQVHYRQAATHVELGPAGPVAVATANGARFPADAVVFNLPPWDAAALVDAELYRNPLDCGTSLPADAWGAFMVYAGVDERIIPPAAPLHHQVLVREPLGEGNSVFLSLSLPGDARRAPPGQRALTISTHTRLGPWWELFEGDRPAYAARKAEYTDRALAAAEIALPGLRGAASLILPGTPVTFQRFTHRSRGWVGGFPQTSLFRARGPRFGRRGVHDRGVHDRLWLVGDSIFPGQSVLATALGGVRVAAAVQRETGGPFDGVVGAGFHDLTA
jgi:C-3',4' desaturase CrtD